MSSSPHSNSIQVRSCDWTGQSMIDNTSADCFLCKYDQQILEECLWLSYVDTQNWDYCHAGHRGVACQSNVLWCPCGSMFLAYDFQLPCSQTALDHRTDPAMLWNGCERNLTRLSVSCQVISWCQNLVWLNRTSKRLHPLKQCLLCTNYLAKSIVLNFIGKP